MKQKQYKYQRFIYRRHTVTLNKLRNGYSVKIYLGDDLRRAYDTEPDFAAAEREARAVVDELRKKEDTQNATI